MCKATRVTVQRIGGPGKRGQPNERTSETKPGTHGQIIEERLKFV